MHTFPAVSPLTVYDYELRHLLLLTAAVDGRRKAMKEAARGR